MLETVARDQTEHLVYESVKPGTGGFESLILTPMQLLNRLTALSRRHWPQHLGAGAAREEA